MKSEFLDVVLNRQPMTYDHRDYLLRDYITPVMRRDALLTKKYYWKMSKVLDQGKTGHCVGFAWAGFGISLPVHHNWSNAMGHKIYYAAKVVDGEANQENGSSSRSGVKAFLQFARLQNGVYAFASTMDNLITWLLTNGPVPTGTNWYTGMFEPDSNGVVKLTGIVEGGHEWMISGVDTDTRMLQGTNSWGLKFGVRGKFYISLDDYQRLWNESGDAVVTADAYDPPVPARR